MMIQKREKYVVVDKLLHEKMSKVSNKMKKKRAKSRWIEKKWLNTLSYVRF